MKFWRKDNDLYTGDVQPTEGAVEITEAEYDEIFATRVITHLPMIEDMEGGEADGEND